MKMNRHIIVPFLVILIFYDSYSKSLEEKRITCLKQWQPDTAQQVVLVETSSLVNHDRVQPRILRITRAMLAGPAVGCLFALPVGILGAGIEKSIRGSSDDWSGVVGGLIGMYTGYLLGNAHGVQLVTKLDHQKVPCLGTLSCSFLGAVMGTSLLFVDEPKGPVWLAPFLFPTIGAVLYVNLYHTHQSQVGEISLNYGLPNNGNSSSPGVSIQFYF